MTQESIASLIPFILILVIGLILGGLIGIVVASALQNPAQTSRIQASKNLSLAAGLWRDKKTKRLVVEIEDKYYAVVDKLPARQASVIIQAFKDLQRWLKLDDLSIKPENPPQTGSEIKTPQVIAVATIPAVESIEPVKVDMTEIITRSIIPNEKSKKQAPPKSIVEQIDEILQKRLVGSYLSNRLIRLVETPSGGVEVNIDGEKYDGVGEVPDLAVRQFIQECVKEWENKK
jgi:hypothetical protein